VTWEVPAHEVHELAPRRTRFCVCIPAIDEDGRLRRQLEKMRPRMDLADVVLADGGSTDGSTDLPFLREAGVRALLVKTGPGRLGAQLRMGLAWALEQRYEGVVLVDGNDKARCRSSSTSCRAARITCRDRGTCRAGRA